MLNLTIDSDKAAVHLIQKGDEKKPLKNIIFRSICERRSPTKPTVLILTESVKEVQLTGTFRVKLRTPNIYKLSTARCSFNTCNVSSVARFSSELVVLESGLVGSFKFAALACPIWPRRVQDVAQGDQLPPGHNGYVFF